MATVSEVNTLTLPLPINKQASRTPRLKASVPEENPEGPPHRPLSIPFFLSKPHLLFPWLHSRNRSTPLPFAVAIATKHSYLENIPPPQSPSSSIQTLQAPQRKQLQTFCALLNSWYLEQCLDSRCSFSLCWKDGWMNGEVAWWFTCCTCLARISLCPDWCTQISFLKTMSSVHSLAFWKAH